MKISVIIPVFNAEKTITRCLKSVIDQTYQDWEIIAIDDGSSDKSYSILEEYNKIDKRIKVFTQENKGPGATRNKAINFATGDFIVFLDSDDYIDKIYFNDLVKCVQDNNSDVVFIDVVLEKPDGKLIRNELMSKYKDSSKDTIIRHQMTGKLPWGGCRKAVKTSIIKENNILYSDDVVGEEALFSFKVIYNSKKISFIDKPYYHYVNYPNSQSTKGDYDPWSEICKKMKVYLKDNKLLDEYETTINGFAYTACIICIQRISTSYNFFDAIKLSKNALDSFKYSYGFDIDKESIDKRARLMLPFAKLNIPIMIVFASKIKQIFNI